MPGKELNVYERNTLLAVLEAPPASLAVLRGHDAPPSEARTLN
jgi:hypothetical protein